jgi:hypothetical protein
LTISRARREERGVGADVLEAGAHRAAREGAMAKESDPRHHVEKMRKRFRETVDHLRQDVLKVDEPQLKAMFETSAEVLTGLEKAFADYEVKNEDAWRK